MTLFFAYTLRRHAFCLTQHLVLSHLTLLLYARSFTGTFGSFTDSPGQEELCDGAKVPRLDEQIPRGSVSTGAAPEEAIESNMVARYSSGVERETARTSMSKPNQTPANHVDPGVTFATSPSLLACESDMLIGAAVMTTGSGAGVAHGQGGVTAFVAADQALVLPVGDGVAAPNWLDVTYAMLDQLDDVDPESA